MSLILESSFHWTRELAGSKVEAGDATECRAVQPGEVERAYLACAVGFCRAIFGHQARWSGKMPPH